MKYILSLFFAFATIFPAFAIDYKVTNIRVDVQAENAIEARDKAMNDARRNAFNVLVGRMGMGGDFNVDDRTIATMVDSFEINREKLSSDRYLASVNVAFNERAVQGFLARFANQNSPDKDIYSTESTQAISTQQAGRNIYDPSPGQSSFLDKGDVAGNRAMVTKNQSMQNYRIQINLSTLQDWVRIKQSLKTIGTVNVALLNAQRAVVNLGYNGKPSALQSDLNMKGLQLYRNNAANAIPYVLMRRG